MAPSGRRREKATSQGKTATTARRRMGEGCDVQLLLFETFGGCGKGVLHLLRLLGEEVQNRLSHAQYDQTSWSARYWRTYQTQPLSVVLARAARLQRSAWAVDPADRKAA